MSTSERPTSNQAPVKNVDCHGDPKLENAKCSSVICQACTEVCSRCKRLNFNCYCSAKVRDWSKKKSVSVCVAACLASSKKCLRPLEVDPEWLTVILQFSCYLVIIYIFKFPDFWHSFCGNFTLCFFFLGSSFSSEVRTSIIVLVTVTPVLVSILFIF